MILASVELQKQVKWPQRGRVCLLSKSMFKSLKGEVEEVYMERKYINPVFLCFLPIVTPLPT
jgi:hypothetical protein